MPGEGQAGAAAWIPLYKKMQKAGKNIYMFCKPGEVAMVLNELSPKGLLIGTLCDKEDEARELVDYVNEISLEKRSSQGEYL